MPRVIYASTACVRGAASLEERLDAYADAGIDAVELGFGVQCPPEFLKLLKNRSRSRYLIHNYFPPPERDFVLNLASADPAIRDMSVELVRHALRLSAELGAPMYSVHAGFAADPIGEDRWGFIFPEVGPAERAAAADRFAWTVESLIPDARREGVTLLMENNVCSPNHRGKLLLQLPTEFESFFARCRDESLGVLLDTGHLRVTTTTFGIDFAAAVAEIAPHVRLLHLHENDGSADQHLPAASGGVVVSALRAAALTKVPVVIEARFSSAQELAAHRAQMARELA